MRGGLRIKGRYWARKAGERGDAPEGGALPKILGQTLEGSEWPMPDPTVDQRSIGGSLVTRSIVYSTRISGQTVDRRLFSGQIVEQRSLTSGAAKEGVGHLGVFGGDGSLPGGNGSLPGGHVGLPAWWLVCEGGGVGSPGPGQRAAQRSRACTRDDGPRADARPRRLGCVGAVEFPEETKPPGCSAGLTSDQILTSFDQLSTGQKVGHRRPGLRRWGSGRS